MGVEDAGTGAQKMSCIIVGVEADEIRVENAEEDLTSDRKDPIKLSVTGTAKPRRLSTREDGTRVAEPI